LINTINSSQQKRALTASTIAFTTCFAVWTIFSIIGLQIRKDLNLNETEFGLLVGTPILSGSLIRLVLGIWSDQYGGRIVYVAVMVTAAIATFLLTTVETYLMFWSLHWVLVWQAARLLLVLLILHAGFLKKNRHCFRHFWTR